jgi:crossover junction endodeoxyribonuclease RusA
MIAFAMPFPPSVNTYWRHVGKKVLVSEKGRKYRVTVKNDISGLFIRPIDGSVKVEINAYPPDNRRRDLDNLMKASLDALTFAGAWLDDSQIVDLRIVRGEVVKPDGFLYVYISEFLEK